ncbi:hypothetical protein [Amphibacillus cookii]|uniref:hypothetical protein n=1 Tax=Amphibacillus cookii TaxID=767787 RepID=UPI00195E6266|nr:hypothetical protein [Amphibacillus cookii]MBM7543124.1 hypothetical protein [Amphibacillus cookii]
MVSWLEVKGKLEALDRSWQELYEKASDHSSQNASLNKVISFLASSIDISNQSDEWSCINMSYHILNGTVKPLENLLICVRIDASVRYQISGKYLLATDRGGQQKIKANWKLLEDHHNEDGEYWFSYLGEKVNRADRAEPLPLTLTWPAKEKYRFKIDAFYYSNRDEEGLPVDNPLLLNVTS